MFVGFWVGLLCLVVCGYEPSLTTRIDHIHYVLPGQQGEHHLQMMTVSERIRRAYRDAFTYDVFNMLTDDTNATWCPFCYKRESPLQVVLKIALVVLFLLDAIVSFILMHHFILSMQNAVDT